MKATCDCGHVFELNRDCISPDLVDNGRDWQQNWAVDELMVECPKCKVETDIYRVGVENK